MSLFQKNFPGTLEELNENASFIYLWVRMALSFPRLKRSVIRLDITWEFDNTWKIVGGMFS